MLLFFKGYYFKFIKKTQHIIIASNMDLNHSDQQNQIDHFLGNQSIDHGLRLFSYHNSEDFQQEQKNLTPIAKKKGRPKGLKTNRIKSQIKEESQKTSKNSGHWLKQENKRYHLFLQIHSNHFIQRHLRRMDKIFKTMADFIETRQAEQCRSHHQKMQKKHKSFYRIIKSLRNQFYLSCDASFVQADLRTNNIFQYDPLISQSDLENQKQPAPVQSLEKSEQIHMQLQVEKVCPNRNFFTDNYENQLHYEHF